MAALLMPPAYIRCESRGTLRDRTRHYLWFINWNRLDERFEMVGLFGNSPRKIFYTLRVSEGGRRIDLTTEPNAAGERNWSTITFEDDRMVWETRLNRRGDPPDHWPVMYREISRRTPP